MISTSIVVNNFNYGRFVGDAIESALAQTQPGIEVIVVDDGSTDNSRAVIERFADRVRCVWKENGGQASALSAGFAASNGDVVIFLDADDVLDSDIAARAAEVFETEPDVARVQWPLRMVDVAGAEIGPPVPNPAMMVSGDLRDHIIRFRSHAWPPTSGNAYAVWVLRRLMPAPPELTWGSDMYLAETTALYGPVVSLSRPGGDYRIHGTNAWTGRTIDMDNIRERIRWTIRNHDRVRAAAGDNGLECPADPRVALDVAFICQRLASLRLEPAKHPVAGDALPALVVRGLVAAAAHPHHTVAHRIKRVIWVLGVGLTPKPMARRLVERFYFPSRARTRRRGRH